MLALPLYSWNWKCNTKLDLPGFFDELKDYENLKHKQQDYKALDRIVNLTTQQDSIRDGVLILQWVSLHLEFNFY